MPCHEVTSFVDSAPLVAPTDKCAAAVSVGHVTWRGHACAVAQQHHAEHQRSATWLIQAKG